NVGDHGDSANAGGREPLPRRRPRPPSPAQPPDLPPGVSADEHVASATSTGDVERGLAAGWRAITGEPLGVDFLIGQAGNTRHRVDIARMCQTQFFVPRSADTRTRRRILCRFVRCTSRMRRTCLAAAGYFGYKYRRRGLRRLRG